MRSAQNMNAGAHGPVSAGSATARQLLAASRQVPAGVRAPDFRRVQTRRRRRPTRRPALPPTPPHPPPPARPAAGGRRGGPGPWRSVGEAQLARQQPIRLRACCCCLRNCAGAPGTGRALPRPAPTSSPSLSSSVSKPGMAPSQAPGSGTCAGRRSAGQALKHARRARPGLQTFPGPQLGGLAGNGAAGRLGSLQPAQQAHCSGAGPCTQPACAPPVRATTCRGVGPPAPAPGARPRRLPGLQAARDGARRGALQAAREGGRPSSSRVKLRRSVQGSRPEG